MFKGFMIVLSIIVAMFLLSMVVEGLGIIQFGYFAPKKEAIRREVFENTKSYIEGKKQDLIRYRLQYIQADDSGKSAIASTIRMMFADFNDAEIEEPELREFLKLAKYGE